MMQSWKDVIVTILLVVLVGFMFDRCTSCHEATVSKCNTIKCVKDKPLSDPLATKRCSSPIEKPER